jgi:hypothetical protein
MAVFQRQKAGDLWKAGGIVRKASSQLFSEGEGHNLLISVNPCNSWQKK